VGDSFRFAAIELKEPPKADVKAWRSGDPIPRASFAVVFDRADNKAYESLVDLVKDQVVSFTHTPNVTPNFTIDELLGIDATRSLIIQYKIST